MPKSINPVDRLVGRNIRIFRLAKHMSQTELGQAIGVSFQQVQKYEKGVNRVGPGRLSQIADLLGVPVERFFREDGKAAGQGKAGPLVTDLLGEAYALRMLQAFAKISSRDVRRKLLMLAESLIS